MNYAVINTKTNKVENIINATSTVVEELEAGLGCTLIPSDNIPLMLQDEYNPVYGRFYRNGAEVSGIPPVPEQIQQAIDNYTMQLINGGIL